MLKVEDIALEEGDVLISVYFGQFVLFHLGLVLGNSFLVALNDLLIAQLLLLILLNNSFIILSFTVLPFHKISHAAAAIDLILVQFFFQLCDHTVLLAQQLQVLLLRGLDRGFRLLF